MKFKFVAVNSLTGYQVKTFRTKFFMTWWYHRPMKLFGQKYAKSSFISIHEVIN